MKNRVPTIFDSSSFDPITTVPATFEQILQKMGIKIEQRTPHKNQKITKRHSNVQPKKPQTVAVLTGSRKDIELTLPLSIKKVERKPLSTSGALKTVYDFVE